MKLVIASSNLHKIREYKAIFKELLPEIDLYSLRDFPAYNPPQEGVTSFEENAMLKAEHAAKALGELVLADDSGLVIPALNGEPGVKSARYAGDDASDHDNRIKLIKALGKLDEKERVGFFECAICLADRDGIVKSAQGFCEGYLLAEERGGNGFGYDPLFVKYDYNKTLAELDEITKNKISHRRKALDKLLPILEARLALTEA